MTTDQLSTEDLILYSTMAQDVILLSDEGETVERRMGRLDCAIIRITSRDEDKEVTLTGEELDDITLRWLALRGNQIANRHIYGKEELP